jgi:hypothetical protein
VHVDAGAREPDRDRVEQAGTVDAADLAQRVPGRCVVVEDDFGARRRRRLERSVECLDNRFRQCVGGRRRGLGGQHAERLERATISPRGDDGILHGQPRVRQHTRHGRQQSGAVARRHLHAPLLPLELCNRHTGASRGRKRLQQRSLTGNVDCVLGEQVRARRTRDAFGDGPVTVCKADRFGAPPLDEVAGVEAREVGLLERGEDEIVQLVET